MGEMGCVGIKATRVPFIPLAFLGGNDTVNSGTAAGEAGRDIVVGQAGDDEVAAGAQFVLADLDDVIAAGEIEAGSGLLGEWLDGNDGEDVLVGGADNDVLEGGAGADVLVGGGGDDNLLGDAELNLVSINWSVAREVNGSSYLLVYTDATNSLSPNGADDEIYGGAGADWLLGHLGDDYLDGGADADVLFGHEGFDVLFGGAGDDVLSGDDGAIASDQHADDYLDGEDGNDVIFGNGGADELYGGAGDDQLHGDDASVDALYQGADYLDGEDGNDALQGYGGDDVLAGGAGLQEAWFLCVHGPRYAKLALGPT